MNPDIKSYKNFGMEKYISDVSTLPFSIINTFEDPNDQLETLNNLLLSAINKNAPLKRVKLTRPPDPWMKDLHIIVLQEKRDQLRYEAQKDQTEEIWQR